MKKSTWRRLIQDVYSQEVASKLLHASRRWHGDKSSYRFEQLFRASRTIRYIEQLDADESEDASRAFTREHIKSAIEGLRGAHREFNERVLLESGVVEILEVFMTDIVSELKVSDLPPEDIEALRSAGSTDPEAELRIRIRRIQAYYERAARYRDQMSLSSCIAEATQQLDRKIESLEYDSNQSAISIKLPEPQPKKKWFKGLGSIARGTVLTGVDISLLGGWWALPLSPDTTIVGGVASIVTGLGDIAIGVGELRGE